MKFFILAIFIIPYISCNIYNNKNIQFITHLKKLENSIYESTIQSSSTIESMLIKINNQGHIFRSIDSTEPYYYFERAYSPTKALYKVYQQDLPYTAIKETNIMYQIIEIINDEVWIERQTNTSHWIELVNIDTSDPNNQKKYNQLAKQSFHKKHIHDSTATKLFYQKNYNLLDSQDKKKQFFNSLPSPLIIKYISPIYDGFKYTGYHTNTVTANVLEDLISYPLDGDMVSTISVLEFYKMNDDEAIFKQYLVEHNKKKLLWHIAWKIRNGHIYQGLRINNLSSNIKQLSLEDRTLTRLPD